MRPFAICRPVQNIAKLQHSICHLVILLLYYYNYTFKLIIGYQYLYLLGP